MCSVIRINGDVAFLIVMFSFSTFFDFIYFGWLAAAESVSWSDPYLGCRRLCIFVGKRCLRHLCACVLSVVLICWVYFWWRSRGARCHAKIWVILFLLGEKFYFFGFVIVSRTLYVVFHRRFPLGVYRCEEVGLSPEVGSCSMSSSTSVSLCCWLIPLVLL